MFLINKEEVLSIDKISKIIQTFETTDRPRLTKYKNYYDGKQDIILKTITDTSKPCNRIVTNYCFNIVNNYLGYLTGQAITYSGKALEGVQDILNYNDIKTADSDLLKNALIYGVGYEINYLDEDAVQRFKVLDSRDVIPVYDNTLNHNLMYAIRYYIADTLDINGGFMVEVYDNEKTTVYKSDSLFGSLEFTEEIPHFYGQIPVSVFPLNTEQISIFDNVITLQDAYNNLLSSEVDDFQAFCDAYLVLKGVSADSEDITDMKQNRVLLLDAESDANYLNKSITDTQIENMLTNIKNSIEKIANSPDFASDSFGTSSGIAIRFRLLGMENTASSIVANMTRALQKRIELICNILNLTATEATWRDIDIIFTRNIPINSVEIAQEINTLRGIVSDKTLISQLPFISDVDAELELIKAQNEANATLYSFGDNKGGDVTDGAGTE